MVGLKLTKPPPHLPLSFHCFIATIIQMQVEKSELCPRDKRDEDRVLGFIFFKKSHKKI